MSKNLTHDDNYFITQFDETFNDVIETIDRIRQFKLGDYLVLYVSNGTDRSMAIQKNSYGAPIKYKVVHVNATGVPFIKKVTKKGNPSGRIYSCAGTDQDSYRGTNERFEFALDPDYADSILLQDEYDPANLHRSKKDIWKAVTEHNKACKIKTQDATDVANFFKIVNVGDLLWTSNISYFLVQDKTVMTPAAFNSQVSWKYKTSLPGRTIIILTIKDKNGKVLRVSPDFFNYRALYKERPRTYKELNI